MAGSLGVVGFVLLLQRPSWAASDYLPSVSASAQAATTLGQTGPAGTCSNNFGQVQDAGGSAPGYTVPSDGTITSFSAASDATSQQVKLLVLQPVSGTTYKVVAKSDPGTFTTIGVQTFPTQIPVQAGQVIGDWGYICGLNAGTPADHFHYFSGGDPALGAPQDFGTAGPASHRANLSATLEPSSTASGGPAPTVKKCKKKKHKRSASAAAKKCKKKKKK